MVLELEFKKKIGISNLEIPAIDDLDDDSLNKILFSLQKQINDSIPETLQKSFHVKVRERHSGKDLFCPHCGKIFKGSKGLKLHVTRKHPETKHHLDSQYFLSAHFTSNASKLYVYFYLENAEPEKKEHQVVYKLEFKKDSRFYKKYREH